MAACLDQYLALGRAQSLSHVTEKVTSEGDQVNSVHVGKAGRLIACVVLAAVLSVTVYATTTAANSGVTCVSPGKKNDKDSLVSTNVVAWLFSNMCFAYGGDQAHSSARSEPFTKSKVAKVTLNVPEPGGILALMIGMVGIVPRLKRKRR